MLEKNLTMLLRIFGNRPHYFCRFLLENKAFNDEFLEKMTRSRNLDKFLDSDNHFNNISDMRRFYESIFDDLDEIKENRTTEDLSIKQKNE